MELFPGDESALVMRFAPRRFDDVKHVATGSTVQESDFLAALEANYANHCRVARRIVSGIPGGPSEEDIVQQVYLDFLERRRPDRSGIQLRAYLKTAVMNKAISAVRSRKAELLRNVRALSAQTVDSAESEVLKLEAERRDRIRFSALAIAIDEISDPRTRSIAKDRLLAGIPGTEVAHSEGISASLVSQILKAAKYEIRMNPIVEGLFDD